MKTELKVDKCVLVVYQWVESVHSSLQVFTHLRQNNQECLLASCPAAEPMVQHSHLAIVHSLLVQLNLLQSRKGNSQK